jgi:hypothetical protein
MKRAAIFVCWALCIALGAAWAAAYSAGQNIRVAFENSLAVQNKSSDETELLKQQIQATAAEIDLRNQELTTLQRRPEVASRLAILRAIAQLKSSREGKPAPTQLKRPPIAPSSDIVFQELFSNPEYVQCYKIVEIFWSRLKLQRSGFPPEKLDKLAELDAERNVVRREIKQLVGDVGNSPSRVAGEVSGNQEQEICDEIRAYLGDDLYRLYEQANPSPAATLAAAKMGNRAATVGTRMINWHSCLRKLRTRLSYSTTPLSPAKEEDIVRALEADYAAKPSPGSRYISNYDLAKFLEKNSAFLNFEQQVALRQLLQEEEAFRQRPKLPKDSELPRYPRRKNT